MSLIAKDKGGAKFSPAPAGAHAARCCWLIDLGTHTEVSQKYGTKRAHKILLGWELPDEIIMEGERKGEPYFVSRRYTLSLHENSTLRQVLESWRGRQFTDKERDGFDLRNVVDKPCLLTITHKQGEGKVYANVTSISPLPKSMKCADRINDLRVYDIEDPDSSVFEALPEWLQNLLWQSEEMSQTKKRAPSADETPPPDDDDMPLDDETVPF